MRLDEFLIEKSVRKIALHNKGIIGPGSEVFLKWLSQKAVPAELINHFRKYSFIQSMFVYTCGFSSQGDVMRFNERDPSILKGGMLEIGCAPNGDRLVIDISAGEGQVGFVDHEKLWAGEKPRKCYAPIANSLGELLSRLSEEDPSIPYDYDGAKNRGQ